MSMSKFASKFDYLLNAFEQASQSQNPAAEGYADKRRALLEYVRKLEAARPEGGQTDHPPVAWRWRNQGGQWWYSETPPLNGECIRDKRTAMTQTPARVTGRTGIARYLRAFSGLFEGFSCFGFGCGCGGVWSIRRSTSSGVGAGFSGALLMAGG